MKSFSTNQIVAATETVAAQLRQARIAKNIELKNAARELGINYIYLDALENGDFKKLPTGIYGKNFLREYAEYLNLNTEELLKMYAEETSPKRKVEKKELFVRQAAKSSRFLTVPGLLKNAIIISLILLCFIYLGLYLKNVTSPPPLQIFSPTENLITKERAINVRGVTEPEAKIIINGEAVLSDDEGYFNKEINLKNGVNAITISSRKKYGRENIITRQILVKNN